MHSPLSWAEKRFIIIFADDKSSLVNRVASRGEEPSGIVLWKLDRTSIHPRNPLRCRASRGGDVKRVVGIGRTRGSEAVLSCRYASKERNVLRDCRRQNAMPRKKNSSRRKSYVKYLEPEHFLVRACMCIGWSLRARNVENSLENLQNTRFTSFAPITRVIALVTLTFTIAAKEMHRPSRSRKYTLCVVLSSGEVIFRTELCMCVCMC